MRSIPKELERNHGYSNIKPRIEFAKRRSGTVVKKNVEYRSLLFGEDMPRKFLDIRVTDYPLGKKGA